MAGSVNKVILVGNLGKDPEVRSFQNGGRVVNMAMATSETWKDKQTGERKEKTQWHNIVVTNEGLIGVCENYLKKGSKVYIEGQLETRKWQDQNGQDRYTTEVVLRPYRGELTILDSRGGNDNMGASGGGFSEPANSGGYDSGSSQNFGGGNQGSQQQQSQPIDEMEDEIPF